MIHRLRALPAALLLPALLLPALLPGCGDFNSTRVPMEQRADEIRAKAARWLWAQQAPDGGWHSETYGLLRSGQSLTPFVLDALLTVPEEQVPRGEALVRRALVFLVSRVDAEGMLGRADGDLEDYPSYATALALRLVRTEIPRKALADRMRQGLLDRQYQETLGWPAEHAAYGAWGMGGERPRPPVDGNLDISMTRYVLEGLAGERGEDVVRARVRARRFLGRCRTEDGSYFFTTVLPDKNKAGAGEGGRYLGYGTTTADAILALRAAGVGASDPNLKSAHGWLVRNNRFDRVPGFSEEEHDRWALSMIFYYRAAAARAFAAAGVDEAPAGTDWRRDLVQRLGLEQRKDGSFRNHGTMMKEDDPFIATALAVRALSAVRD